MLVNSRKVLLLNYSYEPIMVVSVKKALVMFILNKIEMVEKSNNNIKSLYLTIPIPYVIKLKKYLYIKPMPLALTRNNIYFVCLKWTAETGGHMFAASDRTNKYWTYRSQYTYTPTGLPDSTDESELGYINENLQAAFWFVIYGPQTAAGATAGPQGMLGPTGNTGLQGATGIT